MRCTIPVPFSSWRLPYLALLLAATASTTTSIFATKIPHPPQTPTRQPPIPSILAAPIAIIHHQAVPVALHLIPILATIITTAPGKSKTPSFSLSNPYRLLMAPSPEATKSASSVLHLPKTASSILGKRKAQNYSSSINKSSAPLFHKADPNASTSYGNKATKKSLCQTASATTKHSPSTTSRQIPSLLSFRTHLHLWLWFRFKDATRLCTIVTKSPIPPRSFKSHGQTTPPLRHTSHFQRRNTRLIARSLPWLL